MEGAGSPPSYLLQTPVTTSQSAPTISTPSWLLDGTFSPDNPHLTPHDQVCYERV
jgi:hypothetical protein